MSERLTIQYMDYFQQIFSLIILSQLIFFYNLSPRHINPYAQILDLSVSNPAHIYFIVAQQLYKILVYLQFIG